MASPSLRRPAAGPPMRAQTRQRVLRASPADARSTAAAVDIPMLAAPEFDMAALQERQRVKRLRSRLRLALRATHIAPSGRASADRAAAGRRFIGTLAALLDCLAQGVPSGDDAAIDQARRCFRALRHEAQRYGAGPRLNSAQCEQVRRQLRGLGPDALQAVHLHLQVAAEMGVGDAADARGANACPVGSRNSGSCITEDPSTVDAPGFIPAVEWATPRRHRRPGALVVQLFWLACGVKAGPTFVQIAAQTLAEQLRVGLDAAGAGALDRWAQAGLPERTPFRIAAAAVALLDDAQLKELIGRACNGASTTEIMTTVRTQWIGQPPAEPAPAPAPAPAEAEDAPRGRALLAAATAVELLTRLRPGLGLPPEKYAAFRRSLQAAS